MKNIIYEIILLAKLFCITFSAHLREQNLLQSDKEILKLATPSDKPRYRILPSRMVARKNISRERNQRLGVELEPRESDQSMEYHRVHRVCSRYKRRIDTRA